jgi:hypothetical protein
MPAHPAQHKPGETCPRCGVIHLTKWGTPACVGHSKTGNGKACTKPPVDGLTVCITHGAHAPHVREAGLRRVAEQRATAALGRLEVPLGADADPTQVLMEQLILARAWELIVREIVAELDPAELTERYGVALQEAWLAARDRCVEVAAACLKAGIAERQVRVMEDQAGLYADLMRKVLDDPNLGLSEAQRQAGRRIAAGHLRLVAGGGSPGT